MSVAYDGSQYASRFSTMLAAKITSWIDVADYKTRVSRLFHAVKPARPPLDERLSPI